MDSLGIKVYSKTFKSVGKETYQGCSLNIVFFSKILKYFGLCFPLFSLADSVYTHTHQEGSTPALQQNWQSLEKCQNFKEKHNN